MSNETVSPEREIFSVWWISTGPKGGRPRERPMSLDANGLRALLETLPTHDRVRMPDGEEIAGQGGTRADPASVTALVPVLTADQTYTEFLRRENLAVIEDMGRVRKAAMEGTLETLKVLRSQIDATQAFMERYQDLAEKQAERQTGDMTDKIVESVLGQLMPGIAGMMSGRGK